MTATWRILPGDCREQLATLEPGSVQTCVTSPPYFGLRDYGATGQIGLEPTPDEYVAGLVDVFREVRRVLRDDGTCWVNLGDTYGPNKRLLGVPWRFAFAMQEDGWTLRSDIVWMKPNPMPESVTDRPTKSHEFIFLFAKGRERAGRFAHISEADARWLALFVDTEGNITVKRTREVCGIQIAVAGCYRPLLERAQAIVGAGNILERSGTNAPVYYWQVSNKVARDLLLRLYPHLIVKQRQARIGIYIESLTGRMGERPSAKRQALLERLWEANKSCNSFGDPDLSWVPEPDVFLLSKQPRYFYDQEAIREDSDHPHLIGKLQKVSYHDKSAMRQDGDRVVERMGHRNRRSVWTVATQPFPGAHFATFPPKLIEPCILAGSPPKCCGVCGAPWQRIVERGDVVQTRPQRLGVERANGYNDQPRAGGQSGLVAAGYGAQFPSHTVGWGPTCDHDDPTGSSVVLDPFAGAGTTGLVALRHDRSFVGCELNPAYVELARRRIVDDAPLLNSFAEEEASV